MGNKNFEKGGEPLKTLKDIEDELLEEGKGQSFLMGFSKLKANAVKWFKEDKKILKIINPSHYKVFDGLTKLWMKRLDITSEDLA